MSYEHFAPKNGVKKQYLIILLQKKCRMIY